jgi:hypothetical protein
MKKTKNKAVKNRIAIKKGKKKIQRKKVAKKHLQVKQNLIEALKKKEAKIWQEHYDNLVNGK